MADIDEDITTLLSPLKLTWRNTIDRDFSILLNDCIVIAFCYRSGTPPNHTYNWVVGKQWSGSEPSLEVAKKTMLNLIKYGKKNAE